MIGRLQTEQDKNRLLDGLTSAAGGIDRGEVDKLLSGLGKRVFLVQNVHAKAPVLIGTRWCLNYLAGPLTRTQIPAVNALGRRKSDLSTRTAGKAVKSTGAVRLPVADAVSTTSAAARLIHRSWCYHIHPAGRSPGNGRGLLPE